MKHILAIFKYGYLIKCSGRIKQRIKVLCYGSNEPIVTPVWVMMRLVMATGVIHLTNFVVHIVRPILTSYPSQQGHNSTCYNK